MVVVSLVTIRCQPRIMAILIVMKTLVIIGAMAIALIIRLGMPTLVRNIMIFATQVADTRIMNTLVSMKSWCYL